MKNKLKASENFLSIMSQIGEHNEIAKYLHISFLNGVLYDEDIFANYIDVENESGFVSYLSDKKARMVDDPFNNNQRIKTTIGRFLNTFYNNDSINFIFNGCKVNAREIEIFTNLYKSTQEYKDSKFKILKGNKIKKCYTSSNYKSKTGILGSSCMNDKDFLDIYVNNPKVCKILVLVDEEDKILGRALLWKLSKKFHKKEWLMDRVYVSSDHNMDKFKRWAKENDYLYKNGFNLDGEDFMVDDKKVSGRISVKLDAKVKEYPYLDTLYFLNSKKNRISNSGYKGGWILSSTFGEKERCECCDGDGCGDCFIHD